MNLAENQLYPRITENVLHRMADKANPTAFSEQPQAGTLTDRSATDRRKIILCRGERKTPRLMLTNCKKAYKLKDSDLKRIKQCFVVR